MDSFKAKIGRKLMRKRETKIIVPIRSYPNRNRKYHKNCFKMQKMKKNTIMVLFQSKIFWKIMRQRENKNYRSFSSLPDT